MPAAREDEKLGSRGAERKPRRLGRPAALVAATLSRGIVPTATPCTLGQAGTDDGHPGRPVALAAVGTGARYGLSVSTSERSSGTSAAARGPRARR